MNNKLFEFLFTNILFKDYEKYIKKIDFLF